jgi:hypothetical protein
MNTNLPVPERTLPPESAERIRTAIMSDEPELDPRRVSTWMLSLVAVVVLLALVATALILWPRASQSEIAATPSASATPTAGPSPTDSFARLRPTPPASPGPPSTQKPYRTDRGWLTTAAAKRVVKQCQEGLGSSDSEILTGRRVSYGDQTFSVVIYRRPDGQEWACVPSSAHVPLDETDPAVGPNPEFPIITESGVTQRADQRGATAEFIYRALPSVRRVQVRALVEGKSTRWFEGEVRGGFAFVPVLTPGDFDIADFPLFYVHRAFDVDGREIPVKVIDPIR